MATQNIKTQIALKYNTYNYWTGQGSTYTPLKGEVCFCYGGAENGDQRVRFKVGDGNKKFSELEWGFALASDVYSWAKQSETNFIAWLEEKYPIPSLPNFTYVDYANAQNLTDNQKRQARQNIGAGTSSFSGNYADLTGKPELPVITNSELTIEKDNWTMTLSSKELEFLNAITGQYAIINHEGLKIDSSSCGAQYTLYGQTGITYSPLSNTSYTYTYPTKSGTIALTKDIPSFTASPDCGNGSVYIGAKGSVLIQGMGAAQVTTNMDGSIINVYVPEGGSSGSGGSLPPCSASDNGKFLRVVNGAPAWVAIPSAESSTF